MRFCLLNLKSLSLVSFILIQNIDLGAQVGPKEPGLITLNGLTHPTQKKDYVTIPVVRLEWMSDGALEP